MVPERSVADERLAGCNLWSVKKIIVYLLFHSLHKAFTVSHVPRTKETMLISAHQQ